MSAKSRRNKAADKPQPQAKEQISDNISNEDLRKSLKIRKVKVEFRNQSQRLIWDLIDGNEITLIAGPAGTGKSHLSVMKALEMFSAPDSKYEQIIIVTPAVEAEEELGFLPGTVEEKMAPYLFSTLYLFQKFLGERKVKKLQEKGWLKVMPLAYMRGINIDNAIVIFEEAQNCTPTQMKTFLTRIGENAKYIISGDLQQSDRKKNKVNGLQYAVTNLKFIDSIAIFDRFTNADIVRNKLIGEILERFDV